MSQTQPNVLLLQSDEHSFRYAGFAEDEYTEPVRTPNLDTLAERGTVFEQTYCQMPLCAPSRICMLTGQQPINCGAWENGSVLKPGHSTLPEVFSDAGYETCLVGKMHLGGNRQFCGFDHRPYGDHTGLAGHQLFPVTDEDCYREKGGHPGVTAIPESRLQEYAVVRETIAFLREHRHRNPEQPWFLCASFSRPHWPLTAPPRHFERYWPDGVTDPPVGRDVDTDDHPQTTAKLEYSDAEEESYDDMMFKRAGYFACVDFFDEIVGDLLAGLEREGFLDDTIVTYTSDHGEMAGEHGQWSKTTWQEGATRVPWIVQLPDHRSGDRQSSRIETPVSLADLFPTLASLANISLPDDIDGFDLSKSVETGEEPDRDPVFCDSLYPKFAEGTEFRVVRDGKYKYVGFRDAPELLFNLEDDPLEKTNLATDPTGRDAEALERLREMVEETIDFEAAAEKRQRDAREREAKYDLDIPSGSGNSYLLRDNRLLDADQALSRPDILTETPETAFSDWPDED